MDAIPNIYLALGDSESGQRNRIFRGSEPVDSVKTSSETRVNHFDSRLKETACSRDNTLVLPIHSGMPLADDSADLATIAGVRKYLVNTHLASDTITVLLHIQDTSERSI